MNDTKLTEQEIARSKVRFTENKRIFFYQDWVYVVNARKLGGYEGSKNNIALLNELDELPNDVFTYFINTVSIPYLYSSDTPINNKSEIINLKSKILDRKYNNIGRDIKRGTANVLVLLGIGLFSLFSFIKSAAAHEVTIRYTIRHRTGYNFAPQKQSPTPTPERVVARPVPTTVNMPLQPVSRGGENKTAPTSENKEGRKIARINPPKINKETGGIEPINKYLTEQGAKTREIVLAHLSQYYTGDELIASDNILKKEAGYRYDAINEIGACGIVQALPCEKLNCPLTEEGIICQTQWFIGYLNRRYGTPSNAWRHHLENNWY